jgi:hypothetical protein
MKPGDLVRVRAILGQPEHRGKVGVIVKVNRRRGEPLTYDVLVNGCIVKFHGVYLEIVDAAR